MNFARGLLNDPWILFLDEPTLGLDVAAARSVRELVLDWKAAVPGRTVLLTTHYMAEADELCERIAIVDHGRILAIGTPDELKRRVQRESIFRLELDRLDGGVARSPGCPGVESAALAAGRPTRSRQTVAVNLVLTDDAALGGVVAALGGTGSHILALRKSEPSLEDVFVELVGRGFGDEATDDARPAASDRDGDGPHAIDEPDVETAEAHEPARSPDGGEPPGEPGVRLPPDGRPAGPRPTGRGARSSLTNLRAIVGRAYPRVRGMVRETSWVFFEILLPFLATSAFVFVYRALQAPPAVHRLRRARRGDDRVLAERRLDDGQPAVLGEEPGQPRALLRGADEPHGGPVRDGLRRVRHELDPGGRGPRSSSTASTASRSTSTSGCC